MTQPSTRKGNRRSVATQAFDRGDKGFLDEDEALVRKHDKSGDGVIDSNEVCAIIRDVRAERAKKIQRKRCLWVALVVATIMLASFFLWSDMDHGHSCWRDEDIKQRGTCFFLGR